MGRNRWLVLSVVMFLSALLLVGSDRSAPPAAAAASQSDYWLVGGDGAVFPFGTATNHGSLAGQALAKPVVGATKTPSGKGYWMVASDGGIFAFGDATFHGSTGAIRLAQPIVGMASTVGGKGYWLVASDGGIFAFGDAALHGSTGAIRLAQPIVGMAATPSGGGYWMVARDGGIFAFGDAKFHGSTGAIKLNQPIVGMSATPSGGGYWMVASDGGIFAFGDAAFHGSTGAIRLNQPIVAMAPTVGGSGYWLVAGDGGIFAFGTAGFSGSTAGRTLKAPIVLLLPAPPGPAALLDQLSVAAEGARAGYDRDLFRHWVDTNDEDCFDTRAEVLIIESRIEVGKDGCRVTSGDWLSLYDNIQTSDPGTLDVDHMVPLAEAWDSGAAGWSAERREAFANDLGYAGTLVAVTASSNRSKGDQDPAEWKPPAQGFWCDYAIWWTTVKVNWSLTADQAEVDALRSMLGGCGPPPPTTGTTAPPPTTTTTAPPTPAGLAFGTMQCDAPGSPDDASNVNDEWVELFNGTGGTVTLTGYKIHDEGTNFTYTFGSFPLVDGGRVKLHTGSGSDSATDVFWGQGGHVWNNTGTEIAHLLNAGGAEVTSKSCR